MNCPMVHKLAVNKKDTDQLAGILVDYVDGALAPETRLEFDLHAKGCADCAGLLAAQRELWKSLDSFTAPAVSADFDRRLYARMAQEAQHPAWRRWLSGLFGAGFNFSPAMAGGTACAALLAGLLLYVPLHRAPVTPESPQQNHIERIDMDQVEQALEDLDLLAPQPNSGPM